MKPSAYLIEYFMSNKIFHAVILDREKATDFATRYRGTVLPLFLEQEFEQYARKHQVEQ